MKINKTHIKLAFVLALVFVFSIVATYSLLTLRASKNLSINLAWEAIRNMNLKDVASKTPKAYIVQSGSMEPAISTGSLVVSIPSKSYWIGDAITFSQKPGSKNMVTHRIMNRTFPNGLDKPPVYQTSGDANEDFDPGNVGHEQVVGKVALTVPNLGYVADFAKKPYGFILLVIVPATIIIYEELKNLFKEIGKVVVSLFRKKKDENKSSTKNGSGLNRTSVLIPLIGAFFVFTGIAAAYFSDQENSQDNVFMAAASFLSPTPSVAISPTLSITPTPSVSQAKSASLFDSDGFDCATGATATDGSTFGTASFEISGPNLIVDVNVLGATPNATYDIWINQDQGGCPQPTPSFAGAITTDASGNGSVNDLSAPLVFGATNFWVSAVGGDQVLRSTAVTLP